jgi:O-antigen ligase
MLKIDKNLANNPNFIKRIVFIFLCFLMYFGLLYLNLANYFLILAIFVLIVAYIFKDKIWLLLILTVPSLSLGSFLHLQVNPNWVYEASLAEVFILIVFLVSILDLFLSSKKVKIKYDGILIVLFLYLLLSILSINRIIDFRLFVYGIKIITFFILSYFIALNYLNTKKRIKWFVYSLCLTVLLLAFEILFKFYQTGLSLDFFFNRNNIFITMGPIATVTAILVMILPLVLAFYYQRSKEKDGIFILIIFLIGAMSIFLSLGKSAIISLAVAFVYLFFKFKTKRIAMTISALFVASFGLLVFGSFFEGLFFRLSRVFIDVSTRFRLLELETVIDIINNHFWLGVGSGQQMIYYSRYLYPDYNQLVNNFFLQSFVDLGVVGFGLALIILFLIIKKVLNISKKVSDNMRPIYYGGVASMLAVLLNGQVEVTLFALIYGIIFWMILGAFSNLGNPPTHKALARRRN